MPDIDYPDLRRWTAPSFEEIALMGHPELVQIRFRLREAVTAIQARLEGDLFDTPEDRLRATKAKGVFTRRLGRVNTRLSEMHPVTYGSSDRPGNGTIIEAVRATRSAARLLGLAGNLVEAVGLFLGEDSDENFSAVEAAHSAFVAAE